MLQWVNDLRMELKAPSPFGALPETAKIQFEEYLVSNSVLVSFQCTEPQFLGGSSSVWLKLAVFNVFT